MEKFLLVKLRIRERRLIGLMGVFNYMHIPRQDDQSAETGSILPIAYKTAIKEHVKEIILKS